MASRRVSKRIKALSKTNPTLKSPLVLRKPLNPPKDPIKSKTSTENDKLSQSELNWKKIKSFQNKSAADTFVKSSNEWTHCQTSSRNNGTRSDYNCKVSAECPAKMYLFQRNKSKMVTLWSPSREHQHEHTEPDTNNVDEEHHDGDGDEMGRRGRGQGSSSRSSSESSRRSAQTMLLQPIVKLSQTSKRGSRAGKGGQIQQQVTSVSPQGPLDALSTRKTEAKVDGGVRKNSSKNPNNNKVSPGRGRGSPRGRRSRGLGSRGRGGSSRGTGSRNSPGYRNLELDEEYFTAGPANFVDMEVLNKLTGRINNGLNLINQSFLNLRQAEQELMITRAFLESIHESTAGVTVKSRNDVTSHSNNDVSNVDSGSPEVLDESPSISGNSGVNANSEDVAAQIERILEDHPAYSYTPMSASEDNSDDNILANISLPVSIEMSLNPFSLLEGQNQYESRQHGVEDINEDQGHELERQKEVKSNSIGEKRDGDFHRIQENNVEDPGHNSPMTLSFNSTCNLDDSVLPMNDEENTVLPHSAVEEFGLIGDLMVNNDTIYSKKLMNVSESVGNENGKNGLRTPNSASIRKQRVSTSSKSSSASSNNTAIMPHSSNRVGIVLPKNSTLPNIVSVKPNVLVNVYLMDCQLLLKKWSLVSTSADMMEEKIQKLESQQHERKNKLKMRITNEAVVLPIEGKNKRRRSYSPSENDTPNSKRKQIKTTNKLLVDPDKFANLPSVSPDKATWKTLFQPSPEVKEQLKAQFRLFKQRQETEKASISVVPSETVKPTENDLSDSDKTEVSKLMTETGKLSKQSQEKDEASPIPKPTSDGLKFSADLSKLMTQKFLLFKQQQQEATLATNEEVSKTPLNLNETEVDNSCPLLTDQEESQTIGEASEKVINDSFKDDEKKSDLDIVKQSHEKLTLSLEDKLILSTDGTSKTSENKLTPKKQIAKQSDVVSPVSSPVLLSKGDVLLMNGPQENFINSPDGVYIYDGEPELITDMEVFESCRAAMPSINMNLN